MRLRFYGWLAEHARRGIERALAREGYTGPWWLNAGTTNVIRGDEARAAAQRLGRSL